MKNTYAKLAWAVVFVALVPLAGCNKTPEADKVGLPADNVANNVIDIDVTTNVKTALTNDPVLKNFDIEVTTTKGDVRLSGMLDTQSQIDTALRLAKNADGAHAIHNELTIKQ